jgi:polysaccharide export outer membrane protein
MEDRDVRVAPGWSSVLPSAIVVLAVGMVSPSAQGPYGDESSCPPAAADEETPAASVGSGRPEGFGIQNEPSLLPPEEATWPGPAAWIPVEYRDEKPLSAPTPVFDAEPRPLPIAVASPPAASQPRSQALEMAAREADLHTRRAFELGGRRAWFAARAEFILALRTLAQALDRQRETTFHSRALAAALTALREAQDFLPGPSRLEADLDLAGLVAGHRTPALKQANLDRHTPLAACQGYLTFAQEQLAAAAGDEVAGAMALYGLGKLHAAMANQPGVADRSAPPKAVAFYQAALLVNRHHYMASNDLGVLLARAGRYEDARMALEHSVSLYSQSAGWHNLAVVYRQLGRLDLAGQAQRHWAAAVRAETARLGFNPTAPLPAVQWVDPKRLSPTAAVGPKRGFSAEDHAILLCQALGPAAPCAICGVDCSTCSWCKRSGWERMRAIAWQAYAQGEYVGHERTAHVPEYRLRVDDQLDMIYRVTREETAQPYRLNVGDEIRVESFTDSALNRDLLVQPDGTITLRLLGQVRATGRTVAQLRDDLERLYLKYYKVPAITVTPLRVNAKLEDLRAAVDRRQGIGGQSQLVRVTPEGTIALPAIGSVPAQGLTLAELQQELNERYRQEVEGIEVIPVLAQRAPRYVYVLGEVRNPGRFEMTGPTTAIQALSMAGGWNVGAHLRQVVVFRRGDDWRLLATMLDLRDALYGKQPCPPGEIWLSDSDVIIVPKHPILVADDFINLVFTRGIYGVVPATFAFNFAKLSTL